MERRKISAVHADVIKELERLLRLDKDNQVRLSGPGTRYQLELLTESTFFSAYRAFENFLEDSFLLYVLERESLSGKKYKSYLKPQSFNHARDLIQSGMAVLDWTSPDNVMARAETYLVNGEPFKSPIAGTREVLFDMKKIRNHIAHNSRESLKHYKTVIRKHYRTLPLKLPSPGRYLLELVPGASSPKYYLVKYIEDLKNIVNSICR